MASVQETGGSGRKSLNADLNLVPFIDLLSVCICFLLMTAVWTQIGALPLHQTHGTSPLGGDATYDLDAKFTGPSTLAFTLKKAGVKTRSFQFKADSIPLLLEQINAGFEKQLSSAIGKAGPNPGKLIGSVLITPHPSVVYGDLVTTLDLLRKFQITNLGVTALELGNAS